MRKIAQRGAAAAVLAGLATAGLMVAAGPASASTSTETCSSTFSGGNITYRVCVYTDGASAHSYAQVTGGSPFSPANVYTFGSSYVVGGAQLGRTSGPSRVYGNAQYFLGGDTVGCGATVKAEFSASANYGPFGPTVSVEKTVVC
ncbi:hypothetical protein Lfu02_35320 [Longispora fulva]|uniref:Uncharacterized protein n=1 Tax=Longispora fulva TaxID=619741 RepID=A0A8J7GQ27_9ACTN|nr:hypothetical protein [Longispora fulva]MBG6141685.1 hypothetical protein [Longispora fulva]GIG59160.1 hypothetical protein Lfu02_35320 [Longispora fulva]